MRVGLLAKMSTSLHGIVLIAVGVAVEGLVEVGPGLEASEERQAILGSQGEPALAGDKFHQLFQRGDAQIDVVPLQFFGQAVEVVTNLMLSRFYFLTCFLKEQFQVSFHFSCPFSNALQS